MALTNKYLADLLETVKKRNPGEPEFIQAVTEVFETLQPVAEKRQDLIDAAFSTGSLSLRDRSSSAFRGLTTTARYR